MNNVVLSTTPEVVYTLHILLSQPSGDPNNILVNELLNGKNYGTWKNSMEISFIAKNILGFVHGTCC